MKGILTIPMPGIPTGTVTFIFTDIEGSTKLAQQYADEMPALLARHHAILNQAIAAHDGFTFQIVGDSFSAAFRNANDGLRAVLSIQRGLQAETWGGTGAINVCMGLHTGTAEILPDGKYDQFVTQLRTMLPEAEFNALWAGGRAMKMDQVIRLALAQ